MSKRKPGAAEQAPEDAVVEKAAEAPVVYEALQAIDHTADYRIYPKGSLIRLNHLAPAQIQKLIDRGYVRRVTSE
jgi:hypothetical protein